MLQAGASITLEGKSLLHKAVERLDTPMVSLLIAHGCSLTIKSNDKTPLELAASWKNPFMVDAFLANGADYKPWYGESSSKVLTGLFKDKKIEQAFHERFHKDPLKNHNTTMAELLLDEIKQDQGGVKSFSTDIGWQKYSLNSSDSMMKLATTSNAKELLIDYISHLDHASKTQLIDESLNKDSNLFKFFAVQRGFFATRDSAGSFLQLKKMQEESAKVGNAVQVEGELGDDNPIAQPV